MDEYAKLHGDAPAVVTGKPISLGGSPGREAATGRGVVYVLPRGGSRARSAPGHDARRGPGLRQRRLVGGADHHRSSGCKLVGVSNTSGAIHCRGGHRPRRARRASRRGRDARRVPARPSRSRREELMALDCEVLIPAALGGTIHAANADSIRARMVIEGANNPTTPAADEILRDKGVLVVPDVLANAGGVVVSYFEWVQNLQHLSWDEREVNNKLGARMRRRLPRGRARAAARTRRRCASPHTSWRSSASWKPCACAAMAGTRSTRLPRHLRRVAPAALQGPNRNGDAAGTHGAGPRGHKRPRVDRRPCLQVLRTPTGSLLPTLGRFNSYIDYGCRAASTPTKEVPHGASACSRAFGTSRL